MIIAEARIECGGEKDAHGPMKRRGIGVGVSGYRARRGGSAPATARRRSLGGDRDVSEKRRESE